jgi:aminomethyltransferase
MKTALSDQHRALGAKFVDFCDWEMPVQYQGIIQEHNAVRQKAGIFDVSHMGRILVYGPQAETFLDYLSTNKIAGKPDFTATYTVWCNASGGCVDDVIIYKQNATNFFVIVNACNRQKDLEHLIRYSREFDVRIQDRFAEDGIISMQGPSAIKIAAHIFPEAITIKPMHFTYLDYQGEQIILSATGYTGAGGFEIYAPHTAIVALWERFLAEGKDEGLVPVGLGARDTLRLEKGYALYGHELSDTIAASESVSAWTIKWDKQDFLGKSALVALEKSIEKRIEYGIVMLEPGIARADYEVFYEDKKIGTVTSGTLSPTLNKAIAIILVNQRLNVGDIVDVQIRQKRVKAQVIKLPFL